MPNAAVDAPKVPANMNIKEAPIITNAAQNNNLDVKKDNVAANHEQLEFSFGSKRSPEHKDVPKAVQ